MKTATGTWTMRNPTKEELQEQAMVYLVKYFGYWPWQILKRRRAKSEVFSAVITYRMLGYDKPEQKK